MNIGFIGLGNMGAPMAQNMANNGHTVSGFDIVASCPNELRQAVSITDAASGKDVVFTMLPDGKALREVAPTVLNAVASKTVFVDCSTVDIDSAKQVATAANKQQVEFVDAPVSGGVVGAENGTLTFMVGSSNTAFNQIKPLFDIMGGRAVHCGVAGAGQAAKICNNMILGATMIVSCEAFALADKLGLDRQKMFDVVSTSSGYSWSMNVYCPATGVGPETPADNSYKPGFAADLMLKDLRLAQLAAESARAETPIGKKATQLYQEFVEKELGSGLDFSAIIQKFEQR